MTYSFTNAAEVQTKARNPYARMRRYAFAYTENIKIQR